MTRAWRAALVCVLLAGAGASGQPARENAYRANNLGVARLEQFNYKAAADAFREALRIDASLALARINLSIALLYLPDLDGAAREATEAARLLPRAPQPPYIQGLVARAQNRPDEALAAFERVRQIDPRDVGTDVNLGQIYLQQRRYPDAIGRFRAALTEEPFNVTATYNLALALTRAGQTNEGQQAMERFQTLRTSGYGTTFSNAYLEQGHYAEAVASTSAEADPGEPAVRSVAFTSTAVAGTPPAGGTAPASPFGRRFGLDDLSPDGVRAIAAGLGGGLTLADIDGDGDLDLIAASASGQRLLRNDGGTFVDVTRDAGLGISPPDTVAVGCIAADYDNDGLTDIFILRYGGSSLYHNDGKGHFSDATARSGIPAYPFLPSSAAFVDVDHDGDLDLVIVGVADLAGARGRAAGRMLTFPGDFPGAPIQLLRNNGNGTFTDIASAAGFKTATHAIATVPTDFDNRRDIDLLIVNADGPPLLFKNLRDGTFRNVAAEVGLQAVVGTVTSVAAGDINKDDYPDFFFGRTDAPGLFAISDGHGSFAVSAAPDVSRSAGAAQLIDYDNDGVLDLLTWSADGPRLLRNRGTRWDDMNAAAPPANATSGPARPAPARMVAAGDVDLDGAIDMVSIDRTGRLALFRNSAAARNRSVRVQLKGRVSNRSAAGSKIQIRAGGLGGRIETSIATPPAAPADVVFGIGRRAGADVVRVLWPSGVLQAETTEVQAAPASLTLRVSIEELDRKPSSCPFLYTWNGRRFDFVTDFMGGGEMGYWEAPGVRNTPDATEYVRIRGDQLQPKDGRYDLRVTNELEETLFVDRLQLVAITHPADVAIFPNEGMTDPPKPFRLFAARHARPPERVVDDHGHDVTARVARLDRQYPDDFDLLPIRGYAAEHTLTLKLGPAVDHPLLLLTGWTDYAFSSDNVAASQAGLALRPPALQVKDGTGAWRTIVPDIGIPVGRPQTLVVDLSGRMPDPAAELRIVTNMRIYWDQIAVASDTPESEISADAGSRGERLPTAFSIARLDPIAAELRWRGFSAEVRPDGRDPAGYDYDRVSPVSPWKTMPGRYTRDGDVRPLLTRSDDMFVIAGPGDEIALSFDAATAAPPPAGWTRTFLLFADGYSKEMDINSASPDEVAPLPFHGMTRYPYAAHEHYPDTPAHQRYQARFNTRIVGSPVPAIDAVKPDSHSHP
jgi:Tfp pilus assembly protein PilF